MKYLIPALFIISSIMVAASTGQAKLVSENVEYRDGEALMEGYLVFDDAKQGKRPGVLVVHEWMGLNAYAKKRADQLAELGYVAFAADIYGKGIRPKDTTEAGQFAGRYKSDRKLLRSRVNAALNVLKRNELTDQKRIAAIGYCFGGTTVLELARSGADISGVVSFHGGLDSPTPEDAKNIKTKVLALHGANDPFVKPQEVAAFQDEMRKAGIDWYFVSYGNAVHSFTNPDSGNDPSKGVAYNEKADARSWKAMKSFFKEIFEEK
ncbi:MAG TPA: dienelactone hydrolase family protein [Thermodesulfovibrionales bacterium]|nr:dienelactone hydrolase family protein [Thermodesulfovibrionales bacterium]